MKLVDRERIVSNLVVNSRALGGALFAKRLTQNSLLTLDKRLKDYKEDGLTLLTRDLQVDRKALIEEQRHRSRQISRLRKSVESLRQKLV